MRATVRLAAVCALSALGCCVCGAFGAAAEIDFKNAYYSGGGCGPVTLSNGFQSHRATSADGPTVRTDLEEVHTGSLGPRAAVVVVLLRCGGPGGYAASSADVYLIAAKRLRFLASVAQSDSFVPQIWVRFVGRFLYVDVSEDPDVTAPKMKWKMTTYRLSGGRLVRVRVREHVGENRRGVN